MVTREQEDFLRSLEEEKEEPARRAAAKRSRLVRPIARVAGGGGLSVTIVRAAAQSSPVNAGPINFTATFSKPATGFTNADISFAGSTVGGTLAAAVTGTNPYNVAVTGMTGNGLVRVSIPAAAATDATGAPFPATAIPAAVMFDTTQASVTINKAIDQADPTGGTPINFTVVFSKTVVGFAPGDISFTGSTAGGTLAAAVTGSGATYNVAVTGMTTTGNVVASIPAAAANDVAGNASLASTSTDNSVAFNPTDTPLDLPLVAWEGGSTYWAQFSKAAASGWASPTFFPIAVFLGNPADAAAYQAVGINTYMATQHNLPITAATDLGMFCLVTPNNPNMHPPETDNWIPADIGTNPKVVGWFVMDEPDIGLGGYIGTDDEFGWLASLQSVTSSLRALADGRFMFCNFSNGIMNSFWSPNTFTTMVRTVDACALDKYCYTSNFATGAFATSANWAAQGGTETNARTSASYGFSSRQIRTYYDPARRTPFWNFVEVKMPYLNEDPRFIITYAQLEGAVWASIANEARGIAYFDFNGFYPGAGGGAGAPTTDPNTGLAPTTENNALLGGQAALKTAVSTINARITALAPVLNRQSYVWNFGATGIDTMLKEHMGFVYIFASVGVAATTGSKTFTLPPQVLGTSVEVVDESRTLTVDASRQFTDTFANEYSHHTYKIPLVASGSATVTFQATNVTSTSANNYTLPLTVTAATGKERLAAIAFIGPPTATFTSVTIDGQTAPQVGSYAAQADGGGAGAVVSLWRAAGTASTSINVACSGLTTLFSCDVAVWTLDKCGAVFNSTIATIPSPVTTDLSLNVNTPASGAAVAAVLYYNSSAIKATTWTGLTESFDSIAAFTQDVFTGAALSNTPAATPRTVLADLPNDFTAAQAVAGVVVSFSYAP